MRRGKLSVREVQVTDDINDTSANIRRPNIP